MQERGGGFSASQQHWVAVPAWFLQPIAPLPFSIPLPRLPASAWELFKTHLAVFLIHFLSLSALTIPGLLGCLNHAARLRLGPNSPLPDPPVSFWFGTALLALRPHRGLGPVPSSLLESTCGQKVENTFLQLASERRGSQARIGAAAGCSITRGCLGAPLPQRDD